VLVTSLGEPETFLWAPARSLGAPQIAVEKCGKNSIIIENAAGAPWNRRYYLSFNDIENSCNQFVLLSIYLSNYVSIYLSIYTLYIWTDCPHCMSTILGAPEYGDQENLEMLLDGSIKRGQRCIWRPWWSEFRDSDGGHDCVRLDLHYRGLECVNMEVVIKSVWRYTWWLKSARRSDSLVGHDRVKSEMRSEAVIKPAWGCRLSQ